MEQYGGSSPHSRGTPWTQSPDLYRARIIPAFAGNTYVCLTNCRDHQDHPRIRGEHFLLHPYKHHSLGSSPHSRGTLFDKYSNYKQLRIIPAFAGNTRLVLVVRRTSRDHPRIRGEHVHPQRCPPIDSGSSPHSRGTQASTKRDGLRVGIIPAFAGNTDSIKNSGLHGRDHPRIRGEHQERSSRIPHGGGSSPHSRGTHLQS